MKRLSIAILTLFLFTNTFAQSIHVGLRDNQFAHVAYDSKIAKSLEHHVFAGYEQSILSVKVKNQSGRIFAGYRYDKSALSIGCNAYFGSEYSGNWHIYGCNIFGDYTYKRLILGAVINPNYDSKLKGQFNYKLDVGFAVWNNHCHEDNLKQKVELYASYGNMPEYRDNIKNMRVGIRFVYGNLWVKPEIDVPGIEGRSNEYLRVLCSMGWTVNL